MAGQQQIPDMSALLGRPLYPSEAHALWKMYEENSTISNETGRLLNEQKKLMLETEQQKNSLIAQAIQAMQGGWERGGQQVDVGGFSQGGAPMQQVAVGPGAPGREITPASQASYRQPQQGGMGLELMRQAMGLSAKDPEAAFQRQMDLTEVKETSRTAREEVKATAKEQAEEKKQAAITARQEKRLAAESLKAEAKETERLQREVQLKFENNMQEARKAYGTGVSKMKSDPMFKALPKAEQNAQIQDLQEEYESWVGDVANRAKRYGVTIDTKDFVKPKDPAALSSEQIARYKSLSKKEKKLFAKAYEERFGKSLGLKVE